MRKGAKRVGSVYEEMVNMRACAIGGRKECGSVGVKCEYHGAWVGIGVTVRC